MIKALVFDLDGTIIDTEKILFEAYRESFLQQYNFHLTLDLWAQYVGATGTPQKVSKYAEEKMGIEVDSDKVIKMGREIFQSLIGKEEPLPGVIDMLEAGKKANLHIGLATNSDSKWANHFLDALQINAYFDNVFTVNDISAPKPDPEIYTKSVNHFQISPEEAIAFEDSVVGSLAAKQANLYTIAIPSTLTKNARFDHVDMKIDSMASLDLKTLISTATSPNLRKILS